MLEIIFHFSLKMSRFEIIEAYTDTYFELLPAELRRILASYIYHCNFTIIWQYRNLYVNINGVAIDVSLPFHALRAIPELLDAIIKNKTKMMAFAGVAFYYNENNLSIQTESIKVTLPVCMTLIDTLKTITNMKK